MICGRCFSACTYVGYGKVTDAAGVRHIAIRSHIVCVEMEVFGVFDAHSDDVLTVGDDLGLYSKTSKEYELGWEHFFEAWKFGQVHMPIETDAVTRNVHERNNKIAHLFILLRENVLPRQLNAIE